jgi:hypothetical protein
MSGPDLAYKANVTLTNRFRRQLYEKAKKFEGEE